MRGKKNRYAQFRRNDMLAYLHITFRAHSILKTRRMFTYLLSEEHMISRFAWWQAKPATRLFSPLLLYPVPFPSFPPEVRGTPRPPGYKRLREAHILCGLAIFHIPASADACHQRYTFINAKFASPVYTKNGTALWRGNEPNVYQCNMVPCNVVAYPEKSPSG